MCLDDPAFSLTPSNTDEAAFQETTYQREEFRRRRVLGRRLHRDGPARIADVFFEVLGQFLKKCEFE